MKILILVLSFDNPPYNRLMEAQQESWGLVHHDDVNEVYYYGGGKGWIGKELSVDATDAYYYMAGKFQKALENVWDQPWDMIFRTNSSSYVNKANLVEFAKTLPTEKCYAGWTFIDSEDFGGLCVSGAGIFMSRDIAEILLHEIDPKKELEEDVYIGRILRKNGITAIDDKSRLDYPHFEHHNIKNAYHLRFKTQDRLKDARTMMEIHKQIIS